MKTSVNRNQQEVLRQTNESGTDHNSKVWVLKCGNCGMCYGANSTDAWERKCPNCQGGKPGLPIPVERRGENWNREELVIAFNLYNQIPFGAIHMRNPKVTELAAVLGRSSASVVYKLSNFARLDPALQARGIRGFQHGAKGDEVVWREFAERPDALVYESAQLLAVRLGRSVETVAEVDESDLPPLGEEREAIVRLRVDQSFFRKRVLTARFGSASWSRMSGGTGWLAAKSLTRSPTSSTFSPRARARYFWGVRASGLAARAGTPE